MHEIRTRRIIQFSVTLLRLHTICHENFEAEKFGSKLHTQTFTKQLSRNLVLSPYLNSAILNFHIKSFAGMHKRPENHETFLPRGIMKNAMGVFNGVLVNFSYGSTIVIIVISSSITVICTLFCAGCYRKHNHAIAGKIM